MNKVDNNIPIATKISAAIFNYISTTGRDCKLILLHPITLEDLVNEFRESVRFSPNENSTDIKFRGIKVYRSLDVIEGDVVVG